MREKFWLFLFFAKNCRNACTQTAIRFFTVKYKISKVDTNGHPCIFQGNTNFWKLYPNDHSFFYNEIQNFESCTETAISVSIKEILNLTIYHQFSFVSQKRKIILKYDFEMSCFVFLQWKTKLETLNFEIHITYSQKGL